MKTLLITLLALPTLVFGAVTLQTFHSSELATLGLDIANDDFLNGDLPSSASGFGADGDGFRTDPPPTPKGERFPAYTDGLGPLSGLTGLLADNEPVQSGRILQTVEYAFGGYDLVALHIFTGNTDARTFQAYRVSYLPTGSDTFIGLGNNGGYFQSDPSGKTYGTDDRWTATRLFDDEGGFLAEKVATLRIEFYASGKNVENDARDPFDGVNPFTGTDDGLTPANLGTLVLEVDAIAVPEPSVIGLLGLGAVAIFTLLRRR